jgi:hypothetical protein
VTLSPSCTSNGMCCPSKASGSNSFYNP